MCPEACRWTPAFDGMYASGSVDGQEALFTIDTGATSSSLSINIYHSLPADERPTLHAAKDTAGDRRLPCSPRTIYLGTRDAGGSHRRWSPARSWCPSGLWRGASWLDPEPGIHDDRWCSNTSGAGLCSCPTMSGCCWPSLHSFKIWGYHWCFHSPSTWWTRSWVSSDWGPLLFTASRSRQHPGGHEDSMYNQDPGPDSRNDLPAIGSDTILWSWSADRIPQTPITIGSSDRETTKPNSLLPIESWHKSFTGKFRIEITWSWLNKKVRVMISIHDVTMGGVAMSFMSVDTRASWPVQCTHTVFAHDTTWFGHAIFDRYVYVINVIENI